MDTGGGTAPSISESGGTVFVSFLDLGLPALTPAGKAVNLGGSAGTGTAGTVYARLYSSAASATAQPAQVGLAYDASLALPISGSTPATVNLELYASCLTPTGLSANGSTVIWGGLAADGANVTDANNTLDVFENIVPSVSTVTALSTQSGTPATSTSNGQSEDLPDRRDQQQRALHRLHEHRDQPGQRADVDPQRRAGPQFHGRSHGG